MSICKRKDGRWQVTYRDNGRVRSKSFPSGRSGKRDAEAFDADVRLKKATDKPLPHGTREGAYLDELVQEWIVEKKAQGRSTGWLKDWAAVFNSVFLPSLCQRPAHTLTQADFMAVVAANYSEASQATRNRYIGYLKAAMNHAVEHARMPHNPLSGWKPGKEARRKSRLILGDLRKIQEKAPGHLAWALEVAWNIPARPGQDLFGLRFDRDVDHARSGVEVLHRKVGRRAFVVCSPEFMAALKDRAKAHTSGYLIEYAGEPVGDLGRALATAAARAGLKYRPCMYDIRHLWITTMLDKGIEPSVIAYLAGTSVEMIMSNYYEPHAVERARVAAVLPPLAAKPSVVQKRSAKEKGGPK